MPESEPPAPVRFLRSRFIHREVVVLMILCAAALAAFLTTRVAARAAHELRVSDAATWYARGRAHLAAGRLDEALEALGRARALDREREEHHRSFATALVRAGQHGAARQVLLSLRQAHPEDPDINIGLAAIEAAVGAPGEAVRFYQRALFGDWAPDRIEERERVRIEMIEYLLAGGDRARALAQLGLLAADLPAGDPARGKEAARLFLEAGDPERALEILAPLIDSAPRDAAVLAMGGDAAFALGDFDVARGYYARVPPGETVAVMADRRALAERVLANDPFSRRLSARAREQRLSKGHALAAALLDACGARLTRTPAQTEQLAALDVEIAVLGGTLARPRPPDDAAIADGVALVAAVVTFASQHCAPLDDDARAWMLIARRAHEGRR